MAFDPVSICNLALSRLGDRASISSLDPPEGSAQANNAAVFYPLARDVALEARRWGFNTVRSSQNALLTDVQPGWRYAYAIPNNCLKILKVIPQAFAASWWLVRDDSFPFTREIEEMSGQEMILTNVPNAVVVYQVRVIDTAKFPPQFVSALAWLVASYLAGPVIKGDAGRKAAQNAQAMYMSEIGNASLLDAQQNKPRRARVPDSIAARGGSCWTAPNAPVAGPFGDYAYPYDATDNSFLVYPDALGSL